MLRRLAALNEARPETALQRRLDALGPPPPIHEERAALDALLAEAEGMQAPPTFTPVVARGRAAAIPNIPALATRWRRRARDRASGRDANLPIARPTSGEEYEAAIQRVAGTNGFIVPRYTGIQTAEPVTPSGGRKRRRRTKKTRKRRKKRRRRTRKN